MRTVRIIEHISLDGVIQAPGGRDEDARYGHGGWTTPFMSESNDQAVGAAQGDRFDLLLGRRTYDIFARYWPKAEPGFIADGLNAATKYVTTHRPDDMPWGPAVALGPDVAAGIRRIKAQDGPDLVVWGSSTLTTELIAHGLVDEVVLLVYPVLLGEGLRLMADSVDPRRLALVGTKPLDKGVVVNTYTLVGALAPGPDVQGP